MVPVVVLSAHTMALGVVRALGPMGIPIAVFHYDQRDMAHHSRFVSKSVHVPPPDKDEKSFVKQLLLLEDEWSGAVVIPASDETLLLAARHKTMLSSRFRVACPDLGTVRRVVEKSFSYPLAEAAGVLVPRTFLPKSLAEANGYSRELTFPCLVKPAQSHLFYARFGKKMFLAANAAQLVEHYAMAADSGLEVMLQEIIPGPDTEVANYNVFAVNGASRVEFTADHIRNAPPKFGSPRVVCSRHIHEILEPGRRLMHTLNYTGYACVEFKRDIRDGHFKLMEINGRHNLSSLLAVRCGINFPWLEYQHHVYGQTLQPMDFQTGVYWIDLTRDLAYSLRHLFEEAYSPARYLKPYIGRHVYAIYDRKDLRPFVQRIRFLAGSLIQPGKRQSPVEAYDNGKKTQVSWAGHLPSE